MTSTLEPVRLSLPLKRSMKEKTNLTLLSALLLALVSLVLKDDVFHLPLPLLTCHWTLGSNKGTCNNIWSSEWTLSTPSQ